MTLGPLTNRETEIVLLIADGHRQESVSNQLGISIETVKMHVYNCKRCKTAKRVEYPLEMRKGHFSRIDSNGTAQPASVWIQASGGGRPVVYGGDVEMGICSGCSKMMDGAMIKGYVRPEHKCDARCMASRGPLCECSCGGKNHGKSWGA